MKYFSLCYSLSLLMFFSFLTCFFNFFGTWFSDTLSIPTQNVSPSLCQMNICYFIFYGSVDWQHFILCDKEIIVCLTFIHRSFDRRHHLDQWGTEQPTGECLVIIEVDVTLWVTIEGGAVAPPPEITGAICPNNCHDNGTCVEDKAMLAICTAVKTGYL